MIKRVALASQKHSFFTLGITLCFFLCGCQKFKQFMPNDETARFSMDRKFSNLNYTGDGHFTDHGKKSAIQ